MSHSLGVDTCVCVCFHLKHKNWEYPMIVELCIFIRFMTWGGRCTYYKAKKLWDRHLVPQEKKCPTIIGVFYITGPTNSAEESAHTHTHTHTHTRFCIYVTLKLVCVCSHAQTYHTYNTHTHTLISVRVYVSARVRANTRVCVCY